MGRPQYVKSCIMLRFSEARFHIQKGCNTIFPKGMWK